MSQMDVVSQENSEPCCSFAPVCADLWEGVSKTELILLLEQTMEALGFSRARQLLEEESGVYSESPLVRHLHAATLDGQWDEVVNSIQRLNISSIYKKAFRFLVIEQKFLEFLHSQHLDQALTCLRDEFCNACFDHDTTQKLHLSCGYIMLASPDELEHRANWTRKGSREILWARIEDKAPPETIPKPKRLLTLLHQAYKYQEINCSFHNYATFKPFSLLEDHRCPRARLPTHCIATLEDHDDEVWNVAVSHNGQYIASSAQNKIVICWENKPPHFKMLHRWTEHTSGVGMLSWRWDDRFLASASCDKTVRIWAPGHDSALLKICAHSMVVTSACFVFGTDLLLTTSYDRFMHLWSLTRGPEPNTLLPAVHEFKWPFSSKIQDTVVTCDGAYAVVACNDGKVRVIDIPSRAEAFSLPDSTDIISLSASSITRQVLVSAKEQKAVIKLYDVDEKRILMRYRGHSGARFVIRAAFGGPSECFVISGSEDTLIYIWHKFYGVLLHALSGHSLSISAVAWPGSRSCPWLISASDDHTLRIWSSEPTDSDCNEVMINGLSPLTGNAHRS